MTNSPAMRRSNSVDLMTEYPNSLPKKDVQNALIRIVHDNATYVMTKIWFIFYFNLFSPFRNIIDVAAMDAHNLQPQEMNNRIKVYNQKLAQQWSSIQDSTNLPSGLLKDIPNPELFLTSTPISAVDLTMVLMVFVFRFLHLS